MQILVEGMFLQQGDGRVDLEADESVEGPDEEFQQ